MDTVLHARAFRDNYIWLLGERLGPRVLAVDPGDDTPVRAALAAHGLVLAGILCTHHHADHSGGISALRATFGVPAYGPAHERLPVPGVSHPVAGGDLVSVPGFDPLQVMGVPGHTAGHIAFFDGRRVFCGDTLFSLGCGRLFEGNAADLHASLMRLAALPADTLVYCGHEYTAANLAFALWLEPDRADLRQFSREIATRCAAGEPTLPSTIARENAQNPFLRTEDSALQAAIRARGGECGPTPSSTFATLRRWKDDFKGQ